MTAKWSWSFDDEPTIRMLIAEVLEDAGYSAIEASDGSGRATSSAIRLKNRSFDLLMSVCPVA